MKRRLAIVMILVLVLPTLACRLVTGTPRSTPLPPTIEVATQPLEVPSSEPNQATETPLPEATLAETTPTPEEAVPTFTEPADTAEPTLLPLVPTATTGESPAAGIIDTITLAHGTQGDQKQPVDPATVFAPDAVIHAVVHVQNAPANTKITATWSVVDVGTAYAPNTVISTSDNTVQGTLYSDFTLSPRGKLPTGSYQVAIALNGQPMKTLSFTVQ
jgi:hypothetical protein